VHEFLPPKWPVAVWIEDGIHFGQWIVIKDTVVYDPGERTEHHMSAYPRRDWVVALVAQSALPEEFIRIRDRRRAQSGVK
jgi:hypothetical protein